VNVKGFCPADTRSLKGFDACGIEVAENLREY